MSKDRELKILLGKKFDIKDLGPTQKLLGMEIRRDRDVGKLWLSQGKYIFMVLEIFNMLDCKPMSTHLAKHARLSAQESLSSDKENDEISKVLYASALGCLIQQGKACMLGYVDSDNAGDLDKKRSTTRVVLQSVCALSTTEAKNMVLTEASKEAIWLKRLAKDFGIAQDLMVIQSDN
ncbi:unnamed protein product [Prunus armeniaca]